MRILLDACIIFPTVLREVLMETAAKGGFTPLWSDKILAEWRHTAARFGDDAAQISGVEITMLNLKWPKANVEIDEDMINALSLPDENDRHVLAAAIAGYADVLMTKNLKDFPTRTLGHYDVLRREPDEFLLEMAHNGPVNMREVVKTVQERAIAASGREQPIRPLLKRAGMPRLGKFLG